LSGTISSGDPDGVSELPMGDDAGDNAFWDQPGEDVDAGEIGHPIGLKAIDFVHTVGVIMQTKLHFAERSQPYASPSL